MKYKCAYFGNFIQYCYINSAFELFYVTIYGRGQENFYNCPFTWTLIWILIRYYHLLLSSVYELLCASDLVPIITLHCSFLGKILCGLPPSIAMIKLTIVGSLWVSIFDHLIGWKLFMSANTLEKSSAVLAVHMPTLTTTTNNYKKRINSPHSC